MFESLQKEFLPEFEAFSKTYWQTLLTDLPQAKVLLDSMTYSYESGGKRFRPFISYLTAKAFSAPEKNFLGFQMAVEMIHTYSLIHDDLPCMDNDDLRRGQPTNHKKFGEDIALLAGDGLLTQAFHVISVYYKSQPELALQLIQLLSKKAGFSGMIGGQVLDMKSQKGISLSEVELMHRCKTGALIEAAVVGSALIAKATAIEFLHIEKFASLIGLAFQVKDDLLDVTDAGQDYKSYVALVGLSETEHILASLSDQAQSELQKLTSLNTEALLHLVEYNKTRLH